MVKLLVALFLVGGLAAVVFLVPISGRTIADRWTAAGDAGTFASHAWDEARRAAQGSPEAPVAPPRKVSSAPPRERARSGAKAPAPVEKHSDSDRKALDRLLAEHAD